jgi:translation initiation factor IF-1
MRPGETVVGEVLVALPQEMFRVRLESGAVVVCQLTSQARMQLVRVIAGSRVRVRVSPRDQGRGQIVALEGN